MASKTINYQRAVWLQPQLHSLEDYVRELRQALPLIENRKVVRSSGQILKCIRFLSNRRGSGIMLHIVAETPGDSASILHAREERTEAGDVVTAAAPDGAEFMDGDIFALINGNEVCLCSTGLRYQTLGFYLYNTFTLAGFPTSRNQFELQPVGNANKLRLIARGVKRIELNATVQEATMSRIQRQHRPRNIVRAVGGELVNLLGMEVRAIDDNLQVAVSIYSDGRLRTGAHVGEQRLRALAQDLIAEDVGDFIIHTRDGQSITQNAVFIRTTVDMERHGKSVARSSAWRALRDFYHSLLQAGIVEE